MGMKMRMRREEAKLDDDLDRLQRQIINTYKKNWFLYFYYNHTYTVQ